MTNTDTKILEIFTDISAKLGTISGQMKSVLDQLAEHSYRITNLEKHNGEARHDDFKVEILKLLGKCLVISLTAIASLVGAGGLLAKVLQAVH